MAREEVMNMATKTDERVATNATSDEHAHHWRIEEPNGQESRGTCKICGVTREFNNWLAEGDYITNTERRLAA